MHGMYVEKQLWKQNLNFNHTVLSVLLKLYNWFKSLHWWMWRTRADKVPLSDRTGGTDNKLKTSCFETHLQWSVEWVESFCLKLQNIQWLWIHEVPEKNHRLIETLQPRYFNHYYQPLNYQGGYLNLAHVYKQCIIWTEKIT